MRTRLLFALLVFLTVGAFAQVSQVRFEIPLAPRQNDPYSTLSLGNDGIMLYALAYGQDKNFIALTRLDTALKQVWNGYLPVERNSIVLYSRYFNNQIYILLKDRFNPLGEFSVLAIQADNGDYSTRIIQTHLAFLPTHFVVTKEAALIGGYFNHSPLVLYYSYPLSQSKVLPGFFNDAGELDQIRTDAEGNIDIVVSGKSYSRRRSLWIRNYDKHGGLLKTVLLQGDDDKHLLYGKSVAKPGGHQIVCGVYGRYTEYSRGIFVANVTPDGEYAIRYYNYADLHRFFSYMKAKRERRVKERIERRKIRGKKNRFNYRLLVDDLIAYGDNQFMLLGEAFYPHYSYATGNGRMTGASGYYLNRNVLAPNSRGDLIFDGYQYTHAVLIGLDENGNLKWDNSFEINDVRTFELEQYVKVHPDKEKISLLYLFDNVIRSKVIKDSDVVEGKSYDQLHTGMKDDVVRARDTQKTTLEYWYGDVFYASGIQNIRKQRDEGNAISRRVFFINKIAYK